MTLHMKQTLYHQATTAGQVIGNLVPRERVVRKKGLKLPEVQRNTTTSIVATINNNITSIGTLVKYNFSILDWELGEDL